MKKFRDKAKDLKTFAPGAESDIIWNSFLHPNRYAYIKRWVFWILLNLIFIYLLTPTRFNNFIDSKKDVPGQNKLTYSRDGFLTFVQSLTPIIINAVIVPTLVDQAINFSDYTTKIEREKQAMNMLYLFMGMNIMSLS